MQKRHLQGKSNDFFPWQVTEICEKWLILKGKGRKWAGIVWINHPSHGMTKRFLSLSFFVLPRCKCSP